jgi:putative hydrolase of the HAD superfamily
MTSRAVIFDFGGVLFKTHDRAPRHRWDDKLGLPHGSVERIVHNNTTWREVQTGRIPLGAYWADVAAQLGITPQVAATQLAVDFYSGDVLDNELAELIRTLRAEGVPVALLSNDTAELLRPRLAQLGITDLFNPLVISSEIGVMKPHADAYHAVLQSLNLSAGQAVFIDDMAVNIAGAETVGLTGIHYVGGMALEPMIRKFLAQASDT